MSSPSRTEIWMGVLLTWLTGCWGEVLRVLPWEYRYSSGGREYRVRCRKWSDLEWLGLSWLLVLLPVVIVVLLFILFSELR